MRAKLVVRLRDCGLHCLDVELGSAQALAIFDEIPRHLVSKRAEHEIHGALKERTVRPHAERPRYAGISSRKQGRRRKTRFQLPDDDLRVAVDVSTDLHRRRATIATR